MAAQHELITSGKRPYEGSSNESIASTTFAPDGTNLGSVTSSMQGPPDSKPNSRSSKSASTGCRQRVTVVCGECKRLKLRCDRKIPCGSCLKRDTVQRCIYSQAAVEKVDVQSLNIRLSIVEGKLNNVSDPSALVPDKIQLSPSLGAPSAGKSRAFLAVGTHGASVAVNLEGAAGLWFGHLVLNTSAYKDVSAGENASMGGVELLPFPTIPEEGVIDFLTDYTKLFRLPASPVSSEDASSDSEDSEATLHQIGVSPELVLTSLPSLQLRSEIYPRFEAAHIMAPCSNFYVFKQRIEDMCRWAEAKTSEADYDEPHPMRPSLNFFAAAAIGLGLGAQCMLAERVMNVDASSTSGSNGLSPTDASPPGSGPGASAPDRSMPPPPVPDPSLSPEASGSHFPDPSLPSMLYRLSKLALALSMERVGYDAFDLDYVHAKTMQARYLLLSHHGLGDGLNLLSGVSLAKRKKVQKRGKGKARTDGDVLPADAVMGDATTSSGRSGRDKGKGRGPTLALAPEMVGIVSEVVGNARMMGLNHDPDTSGGEKFSLYEKEMRRRLWWEIVALDAFVADCLGESPFIHDDSASTRFPSDVDDENFGPDSANLPAPNVESMQGNIDYFIQRCRFVDLVKKLRRKTNAFRELHGDAHVSETRDMLESMKNEIAQWLKDLPDHLKLKDIPSLGSVPLQMNMKGMSPPKRSSAPPGDRGSSPQYDSPYLIAMRCDLAITARYGFIMLCLPFSKDTPAETSSDDFASSSKSFDTLFMMEPAMYIVRTWQYLHSIFRYVRPSMFMCYSFTRQLFDAAVVLGHMAIQQPLYAAPALGSVRLAVDVLRDPSVLTGRPSSTEHGCVPSEAVRIIEELILKAESAFVGLPSTASMVKRKHEEVDGSDTDFMYHFRFPYVGTGVVSAGPPAPTFTPPTFGGSSSLVDNGSGTVVRPAEPLQRGVRAKQSPIDKNTTNGDPRPALTKVKSSHPGVTITARAYKSKDSARARANSTASTRSDTQMVPPSGPPPLLQTVHTAQHQVPSEPPPSLQSPYQMGPPKPGGQHFMVPQANSPSQEFSSAYRDGYPAPAAYTHAQTFSHQSMPVTVPSQPRSFDVYAPGPQNPTPQPAPTHDPHPFNPSTGVEYPITVHQQAEYEAMMPGMSHPSPIGPQDHRFGRGSADAGRPDGQNPSMHPQPQAFHPHAQSQAQAQAQHADAMPTLTPAQPSWPQNTVYQQSWTEYYQ
ncbi:hypothetical protein M0805_009837 [Coniferiporia weirii]|nr:hypothetical protein M0805_009837 [Coniferiporia weirii]